VVRDEVTGLLVHYDADKTGEFEHDLATAVNRVIADPTSATAMGVAGRERAIAEFSWDSIAEQTMKIYESVTESA
jgi:starch synthase